MMITNVHRSDVGLVVVIEYGVVLENGVDVIKELRPGIGATGPIRSASTI